MARSHAFKLHVTSSTANRYLPYLKRHIRRARSLLRSSLNELSLVLVNDAKMSQLHERFLGISGPTDVLTFELDHDARGRVTGGEVFVCISQARRQARLHGSTMEQELLLYAIHGMLHLSGFDDRTEAEFDRMHRKEDYILTQLGVGPVFAAPHRRPPGQLKG